MIRVDGGADEPVTATIPGRALGSSTAAAIISRTLSFEILGDGILVEAAPETVASFESRTRVSPEVTPSSRSRFLARTFQET